MPDETSDGIEAKSESECAGLSSERVREEDCVCVVVVSREKKEGEGIARDCPVPSVVAGGDDDAAALAAAKRSAQSARARGSAFPAELGLARPRA